MGIKIGLANIHPEVFRPGPDPTLLPRLRALNVGECVFCDDKHSYMRAQRAAASLAHKEFKRFASRRYPAGNGGTVTRIE